MRPIQIDAVVLTRTVTAELLKTHSNCLQTLENSIFEAASSSRSILWNMIVVENNSAKSQFADEFCKNGMYYKFGDSAELTIGFMRWEESFNMSRFFNIGLKTREQLPPTSGTDFVCFMNSDLIFDPNWLGRVLTLFDQHPEFDLICPSSSIETNQHRVATSRLEIPGRGGASRRGFFESGPFRIGPERDELVPITEVNGAGWFYFMKADAWKQIGPWDENFPCFYQDWQFYTKFHHLGLKGVYDRGSTIQHLEGVGLKQLRRDDAAEFNRVTREQRKNFERWKIEYERSH
jgi:hypothetical protein